MCGATPSSFTVWRYNTNMTHLYQKSVIIREHIKSGNKHTGLIEQGLHKSILMEEKLKHIKVYRPVILGCSETIIWYHGEVYDGYWGTECLYWKYTPTHYNFVDLFNSYLHLGYGSKTNTGVLYYEDKLYIFIHSEHGDTVRLLPGGSIPVDTKENALTHQLEQLGFFTATWKKLQLWNKIYPLFNVSKWVGH